MRGGAIGWTSWTADGLFAVTAVPAALGVDRLDDTAVAVALGLFAVSIPVWLYAFGLAVVRTTRGDDVVVASLFFLQGSAPRPVQLELLGALGACVLIAAVTGAANPFGVLVPMLPLGLIGLWAARYGTYPPRGRSTGGPMREGSPNG